MDSTNASASSKLLCDRMQACRKEDSMGSAAASRAASRLQEDWTREGVDQLLETQLNTVCLVQLHAYAATLMLE